MTDALRDGRIIYSISNLCLFIGLFGGIVLLGCGRAPKTLDKREEFHFTFFYTRGITELSCFSAELIEVQPGNVPTPVFSGFFRTRIGSERSVKIESATVRNPSSGKMEGKNGEGTIEVFQERITVSIRTPFPPQRASYFEIRGFGLKEGQSCEDVYETFSRSSTYESLYAIGRTRVIDPKKERSSVGILTLVGRSDVFQSILTTTRSFPMTVELRRDEKTGTREFMLCGGLDERTKTVLRTCDILDEDSMSLMPGPVMNFPRVFGAISRSPDGSVSVSGGLDRELRQLQFLETYEPELGVFLKIRRVIPRFLPYLFSTESNLGIVGGIGSDGAWERRVEILPLSRTKEPETLKLLYFLENAGRFGSCFAESLENLYILGGINAPSELIILKKERIDAGTLEVKVNQINSAKLIYPQVITKLTDYGVLSFPYTIRSLHGKDIRFGNCKMIYFERLLIVATSYGEIYFISLSKDDIVDAFPEDQSVDILGIKIPPSADEFPFSLRKSKKGFTFNKLSEDKAVLFGGYDYVSFQDGNTRVIVPSNEVLLISRYDIRQPSRYKLMFQRRGAFSFMFEDEFVFFVGGNADGRTEVLFVGKIEYPDKIARMVMDVEKKSE